MYIFWILLKVGWKNNSTDCIDVIMYQLVVFIKCTKIYRGNFVESWIAISENRRVFHINMWDTECKYFFSPFSLKLNTKLQWHQFLKIFWMEIKVLNKIHSIDLRSINFKDCEIVQSLYVDILLFRKRFYSWILQCEERKWLLKLPCT